MDRITALRVFRHVAELNSFAEAGRRLRLSPPAISKNISELESYLGVRLFNRTTRKMSLTEAGMIYLEQVSHILDSLEEADIALGHHQQTPVGVLRVAAPVSVTLTCLSTAIPDFLARYPGLSLDLDLDDRRIDIIHEGYDLAIRTSDALEASESSSLIARRLAKLRYVVCASPAYFSQVGKPRTPADLKEHNCLRFSLSGYASQWTFHKDSVEETITINGRYTVSSSLALRDALRNGFGIGLIPYPYICDDLNDGSLIEALSDWSVQEMVLYAIYPSRRYLTPKLRVFLDFIVNQFAAIEG